MGQLIILSGPSCAGKTPLKKAFARFFPEMNERLIPLILTTSRLPRPDEKDGVDFFFRDVDQINQLRNDKNYTLIKIHDDWQACNLKQLLASLEKNDVIYEGNTLVGRYLQKEPALKNQYKNSIFLSPLSAADIIHAKKNNEPPLKQFLQQMMQHKLLRRAAKLGIPKNHSFFNDMYKRAADAYPELKQAWHFNYIIPNPDGEESDHWSTDAYPVGDAKQALEAFVAILQGRSHPLIEHWDENLID